MADANRLKYGLARLSARLKECASEPVTYGRGPLRAQVMAMFGSKLLKIDDGMGGLRIEWTDMDFLIPNDDDFNFDGDPITPRRDDSLWIATLVGTEEFQVFPFGTAEPPWRWSDPHRSMYRIHAKHISTQQFYR